MRKALTTLLFGFWLVCGLLLQPVNGVDINTADTFTIVLNTASADDDSDYYRDKEVVSVPEPSAWALMGIGLVGLAIAGRRKK